MGYFCKRNSYQTFVKKYIFYIFLVFCLMILTSLPSALFARAEDDDVVITPPSVGYTIVVDPGHGGIDPGSIGYKTKVKESELNLKFSLMLAEKLRAVGIRVIMTRTDDSSLASGLTGKAFKKEDMRLRKELINKLRPNMVISLHMNSYTNHVLRGAKVFYDKTSDISRGIAESIQSQFAENLEASNNVASVGDYYMLKCTESPSIICECGFLSNARDEQLLLDEKYQEKIVECIFKGIINFLNIN